MIFFFFFFLQDLVDYYSEYGDYWKSLFAGVAVGAGLQGTVAVVNICCYYLIGIPLGIVLAYVAHFQVKVRKILVRLYNNKCRWKRHFVDFLTTHGSEFHVTL